MSNGQTLMSYVQAFPDAELRDRHENGLPSAFDRLDKVIQGTARA